MLAVFVRGVWGCEAVGVVLSAMEGGLERMGRARCIYAVDNRAAERHATHGSSMILQVWGQWACCDLILGTSRGCAALREPDFGVSFAEGDQYWSTKNNC